MNRKPTKDSEQNKRPWAPSQLWQRAKEKLARYREAVAALLPNNQAEGAGVSLVDRIRALVKGLEALVADEGEQQEKLLGLADLPSVAELQQRLDSLPSRYRALFTLEPLKADELLVAREEEFKVFKDIVSRWEAGRACSVALIGPEGSGKTSLVNCFANRWEKDNNLLRRDLDRRLRTEQNLLQIFTTWFNLVPRPTSLDELVQHLLSLPKSMLLIEGGHNLALRTVGGSGAAEAFFYLVTATRRHHLWLVSFRKAPWTRMNYQLRTERFFTHQLNTLFTDQQQVREALLLRQKNSGYPLVFRGKNGADPGPDQKTLEDAFFREIFAASGGSFDAALYYWLLCLEFDPAQQSLQACTVSKVDFSYLRKLDPDQLFTLAEALNHGELAAEEHGAIFHQPPLASLLQLEYLAGLNLLIGEGEPVRYRLNPIFYRPVTSTLEAMNILY